MSRIKNIQVRTAMELKDMLDEVRIARLRSGKDNDRLSYPRLTLAMSRIPNLRKVLLESDIKDGF